MIRRQIGWRTKKSFPNYKLLIRIHITKNLLEIKESNREPNSAGCNDHINIAAIYTEQE